MTEGLNQVYNFDDVQEYFEFILGGNTYRFRYLTGEELEVFIKLKKEEQLEYFKGFVTKLNESSPDFIDAIKKMTSPQIRKFIEMIKTEFGQ